MNNPALYFATPPVNMIWALRESLRLIKEEGIENRYVRHEKQGAAMRVALSAMGFKLTAAEGSEAPTLSNCLYMDGVSDAEFRGLVYGEGVTLAGALGSYAGKAFRIGHMGNVDDNDLITALSSIERTLIKLGVSVEPGTGAGAYMKEMR